MMRAIGLGWTLVLCLPSAFRADVAQPRIGLGASFGPWGSMATAIVGVRLESAQEITIGSGRYAAHLGVVLAIFKKDSRLPSIGGILTMLEQPCQFCTEDGKSPPWEPNGPIPPGGHWILFLLWDQELGGFRIVQAVF
jgi:hypothetical protein